MEEEKYTVYDLETPPETAVANHSDNADNPSPHSIAETELTQMVREMGTEKALEILKGNRNAAIEQILTEVEANTDRALQSGTSAFAGCSSIFDLAAMA